MQLWQSGKVKCDDDLIFWNTPGGMLSSNFEKDEDEYEHSVLNI